MDQPFSHLPTQHPWAALWLDSEITTESEAMPDEQQGLPTRGSFPPEQQAEYLQGYHAALDAHLVRIEPHLQRCLDQADHSGFIQAWAHALEQTTFTHTNTDKPTQRASTGRGATSG